MKFELYNAFNNQSLVAFNTAVRPDTNGPVDAIGQPIDYIKGPNFGKGTAVSNYPQATTVFGATAVYARTFLMSFGMRF